MAWRIDEVLVRAQIDNRRRGRVTGTLWFVGLEHPITLDLEGNAWRDLAGRLIHITHRNPMRGNLANFAARQEGVVGDITASRKVRIPDVPMEEFLAGYKSGKAFTFHWANALYLEWFSQRNGRVVIESADCDVEVVGEPAWEMTPTEEEEQRRSNQRALTGTMDRMLAAFNGDEPPLDEESERPTSRAEAAADAEDARMNLLMDRTNARLEREGHEGDNFERIWEEEREKLRRERGELEPEPLTPEEEAERAAWIEEFNAAAEALEDEKDKLRKPREWHPLVKACSDLGTRLHHDVHRNGWVAEGDSSEHPLREILYGVRFASAKLAGALRNGDEPDAWPPDPRIAGDTLVRLKKARSHLRDALAGLEAADEQQLAESTWRSQTRREIRALQAHAEKLIAEMRSELE